MPSPGQGGLGGLQGLGNALGEDEWEGHSYEQQLSDASHLISDDANDGGFAAAEGHVEYHARRTNNFSLADELASAMDPSSSSGSTLLQELGLEEEEEEGEEDVDDEHSCATIPSQSFSPSRGRRDSTSQRSDSQTRTVHEPPRSPNGYSHGHGHVGGRTSLRRPKSRASHVSLRHSVNGMASAVDRQMQEDEHAADAFAQGMVSIEHSIHSTQGFLEHIHDSWETLEESNAAEPATSMSGSSLFRDRQPILERLLNTFIKTFYEFARLREDQTRELAEAETSLRDPDPAWQGVLAEMEPLPTCTLSSDPTSTPLHSLPTLVEESEDPSSGDDPSPHAGERPATSTTHAQFAVSGGLSDLRLLTEGVVDTLGTISEHTQVGKATNLDAARKFRSMSGALTGLRSEAESVERSQAYLSEWEQRELQHDVRHSLVKQTALPSLSSAPRSRKSSNNSTTSTTCILSGRYSDQVRQELKAAFSLLEASHDRARMLLGSA